MALDLRAIYGLFSGNFFPQLWCFYFIFYPELFTFLGVSHLSHHFFGRKRRHHALGHKFFCWSEHYTFIGGKISSNECIVFNVRTTRKILWPANCNGTNICVYQKRPKRRGISTGPEYNKQSSEHKTSCLESTLRLSFYSRSYSVAWPDCMTHFRSFV